GLAGKECGREGVKKHDRLPLKGHDRLTGRSPYWLQRNHTIHTRNPAVRPTANARFPFARPIGALLHDIRHIEVLTADHGEGLRPGVHWSRTPEPERQMRSIVALMSLCLLPAAAGAQTTLFRDVRIFDG